MNREPSPAGPAYCVGYPFHNLTIQAKPYGAVQRTPHCPATELPDLRAFTLIELVTSLAIVSVLLVAMGSAITIAMHALPDPEDAGQLTLEQPQALTEIFCDLQFAKHVTEHTSHAVTFTVADRDGDNRPETIRYAWSGTAGEPLTREVNAGQPVTVFEDVHQFNLSYVYDSVIETYPGPMVESAEVELNSYDFPGANDGEWINQDKWAGQYFKPRPAVIPPGSISYSVTRYAIKMRGSPSRDIPIVVATQHGTDWNNYVLDSAAINDSGFSQDIAEWKEVTFNNVKDISPGQMLCVFTPMDYYDDVCYVRYSSNPDPATQKHMIAYNQGATWEVKESESSCYYAYGKFISTGPDQMVTHQYITRVNIELQTGGDIQTVVQNTCHLLNRPEKVNAIWDLDFDYDPNLSDLDGDGQPDYVMLCSDHIDPSALVNGVWTVNPGSNLNCERIRYRLGDVPGSVIVAACRFRASAQSGNLGAILDFKFDYQPSTKCVLIFMLSRNADGSQKLNIYNDMCWFPSQRLCDTITGLTGDFIDLKFIADMNTDNIYIEVDGRPIGTFTYNQVAWCNSDPYSHTGSEGYESQFDYFRVRVLE